MKQHRVLTTGLGLLVALTGVAGLSACSNDADATSEDVAVSAPVNVDVAADLELARTTVLDALAEDPSWSQVMLASDVDAPTQKYGLLVMPYAPSDAASRVQGTITIEDGKFTIEADSAATGETWQIDQDGAISQVTE